MLNNVNIKCPFCGYQDGTVTITGPQEEIYGIYKENEAIMPSNGGCKIINTTHGYCKRNYQIVISTYDCLKCDHPSCNEWVVVKSRKDMIAVGCFQDIDKIPQALKYDAIFKFKCIKNHDNYICSILSNKHSQTSNLSMEI